MRSTRAKAVIATAGTFAVSFGLFGSSLMGVARADYSPGAYNATSGQGDIVGVGSDTLQNLLDFTADGDYTGSPGANFGQKAKVVSFDATADQNARLSYNNVSGTTSSAQNPTIVIRSGTVPVQRPNGSSKGILALNNDVTATTTPAASGLPELINFARASRLPNSAENTTAVNNGWGGLRTIQIATETLAAAVATGSHAPTGLSIAQLRSIYNCSVRNWNDPSLGGSSPNVIIPILPQIGSGTRGTFLGDLGLTDAIIAAGGCVVTSEENDPIAISQAVSGTSTGLDAVGPMSSSRLNLFLGVDSTGAVPTPPPPGGGYFHNPNTPFSKSPAAFPGAATIAPGVHILNGPAVSGTVSVPSYSDNRGLFVVVRNSDAQLLNTPNHGWQTPTGRSWMQTLFLDTTGGTPLVNDIFGGGPGLIQNAGATPAYQDCGIFGSAAQTGTGACTNTIVQ